MAQMGRPPGDWQTKYENLFLKYSTLYTNKRKTLEKLQKYRKEFRQFRRDFQELKKQNEILLNRNKELKDLKQEFKDYKTAHIGKVQYIVMEHDKFKAMLDRLNGKDGPYPSIDYNEVMLAEIYKYASLGCTDQEIANHLFVDHNTLTSFCKKYPDVRKIINNGRDQMKSSLRRKQFEVAMEGNPQMLVHLGKNLLGQSDKITQETTVNVLKNIIDLDTDVTVIPNIQPKPLSDLSDDTPKDDQ